MQLLDLEAHLHPQLGVEVRQRLVEQERRRLAHDRAPHGHTLALPAGELARLALEQRAELEDPGGAIDAARDVVLGQAADAQPVGHVVEHAHVRVERVVLEHHRDVPVLRLQVVDHAIAYGDLPGGDLLEARDHPQQRRLAAPRRADDDDELAVGHGEVDAVDHGIRPVVLAHAGERDARHLAISPCPRGP